MLPTPTLKVLSIPYKQGILPHYELSAINGTLDRLELSSDDNYVAQSLKKVLKANLTAKAKHVVLKVNTLFIDC